MNEWQSFCLAQMQIDRWIKQKKPAVSCYLLLKSQLQSDERHLLVEMLKYKQIKFGEVQFINNTNNVDPSLALWIFDDNVALKDNILKTPSLKALLTNPICKKSVFKALASWQV